MGYNILWERKGKEKKKRVQIHFQFSSLAFFWLVPRNFHHRLHAYTHLINIIVGILSFRWLDKIVVDVVVVVVIQRMHLFIETGNFACKESAKANKKRERDRRNSGTFSMAYQKFRVVIRLSELELKRKALRISKKEKKAHVISYALSGICSPNLNIRMNAIVSISSNRSFVRIRAFRFTFFLFRFEFCHISLYAICVPFSPSHSSTHTQCHTIYSNLLIRYKKFINEYIQSTSLSFPFTLVPFFAKWLGGCRSWYLSALFRLRAISNQTHT